MAHRLKLIKRENGNFLSRHWPVILIIGMLVTCGYLYLSVPLLIGALVCVSLAILCSNTANAFYWALFLVPNIRMLDPIGVEYLVNVMMALPLVVYLFRFGTKRLSTVALLGGIALLVMEMVHDAILNDLKDIINIGGWVLNFVLCIMITSDSRVELSKEDVFSALSTGIILSMVMFMIANEETVAHILETLESDNRLKGFAGDPNAYSLYIVLAIACAINIRGNSVYKFTALVLLVSIGLLTASKMGLITIVVELLLLFLQVFNRNKENKVIRRFAGWTFAAGTCLMVILRDYIAIILRNFTRRAGASDLQNIDVNRFTTGRFGIFVDYLEILGTNVVCLLFGYGFNYHKYLHQVKGAVAHNTYLDIILTWGLVGMVVLVTIIYLWVNAFWRARQIQKISFVQNIPMIALLITFMALSCLSASMFPFVLAVAFIQWIPNEERNLQTTGAG